MGSSFIRQRVDHLERPPVHSHQLRKRAFTAPLENDIDPRKAAIAYGCNPDTVMKHYVALDEQEVTEEVTTQLAACLAPKPKAELLISHSSPPTGTKSCPAVPNDAQSKVSATP
jgi:hypothetical protein